MFVRTQTNGSRTYLLPVDNIWADGKVKQRVLARLGRLDELLASGQLDALVQSLARFSEKLCLLGAHARAGSLAMRHTPKLDRRSSFSGSGSPVPSTRSRRLCCKTGVSSLP